MQKYPWTTESITFMRRAAERSEYHALLASRILRYLSGGETVCEPGCGTGDLSLALAPHVSSLTAYDTDPLPLAALRERAARKGLTNLTVAEQDAFALPDSARWDAAVFCYFAMPGQILSFSRAHADKHVFVIKRAYKLHRFSVADIPITGDSLQSMCALLEERRIPYEQELLSAEMGQPFRDLQEARRFFALYSRDDHPESFSDAQLLTRLMKTDDPEFPYYLPGRKEVGLIHFSPEAL